MTLTQLGWNNDLQDRDTLARVVRESRGHYWLLGHEWSGEASLAGAFRYTAATRSDYPVVGDWVRVRRSESDAQVDQVLPRKTVISRKAAGTKSEEQILASNVDTVLITMAVDGSRSFNPRGLERYLAQIWDGGANPVVVLNKADLAESPEDSLAAAEAVAMGVDILMVSALTGLGIEDLRQKIPGGTTACFLGPSGAGKSSLVNALRGDRNQDVGEVRKADGRGRHTTTTSQFVFLADAGLVIDTPGLREVGLWSDSDGLEDTFPEIAEAAANCRFSDCHHQGEPGCAVQEAVALGEIDHLRFENYLELRRELSNLEARRDEQGRRDLKKKEKDLAKWIRAYGRSKNRR